MIPGSIIRQEEDIHPATHGPGRKLRGEKMSNKELILPEKATLETTGEEIRRLERKAIYWEPGE